MKELECETISDQVVLFKHKKCYNDLDLSKRLQISPDAVCRRIAMDNFRFDEIRALKRLFKKHDLKLKI